MRPADATVDSEYEAVVGPLSSGITAVLPPGPASVDVLASGRITYLDRAGTLISPDVYANYHLPDASGSYGLGADGSRPGETCTLEIDTEGVTLRGEVTVPEDLTVSVVVRDGRRVAEWPRVDGAAGSG